MTEPLQEGKIRGIYRELLAGEIRRPEVARAKKEFLGLHFETVAPAFFPPVFLIPALAMLALFLVFGHLQERFIPEIIPTTEFPGMRIKNREEKPAVLSQAPLPSVQVKRISSRTGATMVYQKTVHDHETPITIIWVFTGGNNP